MRYEHVVFDLDGTLIDSRADLAHAVNHMLRTFGRPQLSVETVTGYIGEGARMLVKRALGPEHEHRLEAGLQIFMAYYDAHLVDRTRLHPGIADMLHQLKQQAVLLSVLSNKPVDMSRAILDGLGVLSLFDAIFGGDSFATRKPDPAGLEQVRKRAGTSRERLLVVGDSLIDLRTAQAAGVDFCGVGWGFGGAGLKAAGAQRIINKPAELLTLLQTRTT